MNLIQVLIAFTCLSFGWTKERVTELAQIRLNKSVLSFVREKTLDLSCKMCRMCVRSRSCDFYVKLKRTCKTLISLPFVCNNGTKENIGLKVDITSSKTINNSINITRVIIGEDFIRVFAAQHFYFKITRLETLKSCKSNHMSCSNIHNCYNQFATKDKIRQWFPLEEIAQFGFHLNLKFHVFSFCWKFS